MNEPAKSPESAPESRRWLLIVPGLLGPAGDPEAVAALAPDLPRFSRLLARAQCSRDAVAGGEAAVCEAFGMEGPPWPVAAAARLGEADRSDAAMAPGADEESRWWVRADPVHLRIAADHARLSTGYMLALTAADAERLLAPLNAHFAANGLRIEAPAADRWYLALDREPGVETHAPAEVAGRNVDAFLPAGPEARLWRGRINEAQMLLHDAPVNSEREAAGALPVNSLWFWGGGAMPRPPRAPARLLADDPLSRGLGRLARAASAETPAPDQGGRAGPGTTLAVDWGPRDPLVHGEIDGWLDALARVERDWIAPLLERLRAGGIDELELRPADGRRFRLRRAGLRRFWRRPRPWHRWLEPGS